MGLGLENPLHIAIVLVVLLLLFGARKLPEMGRGLGQGMREFKESLSGRDASSAAALPENAEDRGRAPVA